MSTPPVNVTTDDQIWGISPIEKALAIAAGKRYRALASARFWRKQSLESANPKEALWFAENQELLAADMAANPFRYGLEGGDKTDWEIFKEAKGLWLR
jgi:hypothetical protein